MDSKRRIIKQLDAGGGPNGEDVVHYVDTETGHVVRTEVQVDGDRRSLKQPSAATNRNPLNDSLPTAEDFLREAEKRRAQEEGVSLRELLGPILNACHERLLEGKHTHLLTDVTSTATVKLILKELRKRHFKVKLLKDGADDSNFYRIQISWPTKSRTVTRKTKKAELLETADFTSADKEKVMLAQPEPEAIISFGKPKPKEPKQ